MPAIDTFNDFTLLHLAWAWLGAKALTLLCHRPRVRAIVPLLFGKTAVTPERQVYKMVNIAKQKFTSGT